MRPLSRLICLGLGLSLITTAFSQSNSSDLPVGSCTPTIPCSNGACCNGQSGFCGFGPAFCNPIASGGNCTSNCGALAECGPFAAAENITCPLNVCCSEFGFCGTTEEFCATGCQSNCNPPGPRSCDPEQQTALHRRIGYYEGWAVSRLDCSYPPESISAETLTHVNFAFALISNSFTIIEMTPGDANLWSRTTNLKKRNPTLKVFLSIGGWSFNDPPTSNIFSNIVGSEINTDIFIVSAMSTLQAYGFDGIDIDWEYPAAYDRGGNPADKANYVTFMAALKGALAAYGYGLTFTAPSSFWYLQHFDLPGLMQHADWVNVMTYDLHGTWDGTDPYIGAVVLAHTNLTEIDMTLSLFNNVGIDPSQIVLGVGFYGRSFQLASSSCVDPGCPFIGGAAPGPCSANSGTLTYAEIENIINQNNLQATFDEEAAVKYVTWNGDQWVSYDDAETFKIKMDYANSRCLGGTMIWSVDQDDGQYTALQALYPTIGVNAASSVQDAGNCMKTNCGQDCETTPVKYAAVTTLTTNFLGQPCPADSPAKLCCPSGDPPQNCAWRGGGSTTCNPTCNLGEITLARDPVGTDGTPPCLQGTKAFCCATGESNPLQSCRTTACNEECAAGETLETFIRMGTCQASVCCPPSVPRYMNCKWVGDLPTCLNAVCPVGQAPILSDIQGDAATPCVGGGHRLFCCDPQDSETFLPVPENYVLPAAADNTPASFTVDFDDDIGTPDESQTGSGSSGEPDDGTENDSAFGEVFMTSPHVGSVSSLDLASDWVIHECDPSSDQPQQVLIHCSKSMDSEDSGCAHVFMGTAENTVVRMPKACGLGPYARVVSLAAHEDQSVLPIHIRRNLPDNELVYLLNFDYNFAAIPDENGPIYMRADVTDIPGYWDEMINSPPDAGTVNTKRSNKKRNFHQSEELERRWFGPFDRWLQKLNTITSKSSKTRNFHWAETYTIFHQEESCPNFSSSLDISVTGRAQANSRFGYYLEATENCATIIPPAIQQCYVYLKADASARATFTITGLAEAEFGTGRSEIISFGFPGLYYPGLLTIGPSLHLYAELTGELSMGGTFTTSVGYEFPPIDIVFGKQDNNADEEQDGGQVNPNGDPFIGTDYDLAANVNLGGNIEASLSTFGYVPSLQLGVSVLGGAVLDAQVFAEADIYAGVGITGSVSIDVAPNFCINPYFGVNLNAGLTGSVLFWRDNEISTSFYSNRFDGNGKCFAAGQQATSSTRRSDLFSDKFTAGAPPKISHLSSDPAYAVYENSNQSLIDYSTLIIGSSQISKRGVPFLPGNLLCPEVGNQIGSTPTSLDCDPYSDSEDDSDDDDDATSLKRTISGTFSTDLFHILAKANSIMKTCKKSIAIPNHQSTTISGYYDLASPTTLDPVVGDGVPLQTLSVPASSGGDGTRTVYAREHPYEVSMLANFVDYLKQQTDLYSGPWCTWVTNNLDRKPPYNPPEFGGRSLFDALGQTCFPQANSPRPWLRTMPVLEHNANKAKGVALQSKEAELAGNPAKGVVYKMPPTLCQTKQVSWIRSAAMVPSYLNRSEIGEYFVNMSNCVRDQWVTWETAYLQSGTAPGNAAQVNIGNLYDNWIHSVVASVPGYIKAQVAAWINLYNDGSSASAPVTLSLPVLIEEVVFGGTGRANQFPNYIVTNVPVTRDDLTDEVFDEIGDQFNWINQLPTHP
ncbi:chitin-binding type-1 domain-containing protein [Favolaschia claudopus]|uniref:Chitin-binding type-1 domain-containing protein n=1 Tax=Favolaschia claudopus TaxID=2862362 RepID=A0AAW0AM59_9AGAR